MLNKVNELKTGSYIEFGLSDNQFINEKSFKVIIQDSDILIGDMKLIPLDDFMIISKPIPLSYLVNSKESILNGDVVELKSQFVSGVAHSHYEGVDQIDDFDKIILEYSSIIDDNIRLEIVYDVENDNIDSVNLEIYHDYDIIKNISI